MLLFYFCSIYLSDFPRNYIILNNFLKYIFMIKQIQYDLSDIPTDMFSEKNNSV